MPHYDGPCRRTHGHNYRLTVFVEGSVDRKTGIAVDFMEVKRLVNERVLRAIDHNDLNRVLVNPTAENVVAWMWLRLEPSLSGLKELRLFETDDAGVIYRGSRPLSPNWCKRAPMKNETAKRDRSPDTDRPDSIRQSVDAHALEQAFGYIVRALPIAPGSGEQTARRAAEAWAGSLLDGYSVRPESIFSEAYEIAPSADGAEAVSVRDIDFHGMCPHHLLPFRGVAHVSYVPAGRLVSLSGLVRLVHCFAHRLEIQEVVTRRIGETLLSELPAEGAAVALVTDQACMTMRGVKQAGAKTVTRYFGGSFRDDDALREEFLSSIRPSRYAGS